MDVPLVACVIISNSTFAYDLDLWNFLFNVSGMTFTTPSCFIAVVANSKMSLVARYIVQELIGVLFSHIWLFSL